MTAGFDEHVLSGESEADGGDERRRSVVRMFPDYANSVLWFVEGAVPYAHSGLSRDLIVELEKWEEKWLRAIAEGVAIDDSVLERQHDREGRRLARQVAAELGEGFAVELSVSASDDRLLIRSRDVATNRAAAAAFAAWAQSDRIRSAEIARMKSAGGSFGWFASTGGAEAAAARFYPQHKEGGESG